MTRSPAWLALAVLAALDGGCFDFTVGPRHDGGDLALLGDGPRGDAGAGDLAPDGPPPSGPCSSLSLVGGTSSSASAPASQAEALVGAFTFELWVLPGAAPGVPSFLAGVGTQATVGFGLWIDSSGAPFFVLSDGSSQVAVVPHPAVPLEAKSWTHLAGTFDPGPVDAGSSPTAQLWINGQPQGAMAVPYGPFAPFTDPLRFGVESDASTHAFAGNLDEVRLSDGVQYVGAFTPAPRAIAGAQTRALYHFDEASGTTATDVSVFHNDATLAGAKFAPACPP